MTDEDWLQFEDPEERRAAIGPALVVPPKVGPRELAVSEEMHRRDDNPGCNVIEFIDVDDETGKESWALGPSVRGRGARTDEGQRWKAIMKWPRVPTIEEVAQFKANAIAARLAKWWDRLAAARGADEQYGFTQLEFKPAKGGSEP